MLYVRKQLIHEMVADQVKQYIRTKGLQKGDWLPSMAELGEKFDVSRTSIREALRHLEALHVVEIVNGRGVSVKDAGAHHIQTRVIIESEKTFLLELCDVRRGLEGRAVELAAMRATNEQLVRMEENLRVYERLRILNQDTAQADLLFHQTLYEASHNPTLCQMIEAVYDSFHEFWQQNEGIQQIFEDTYHLHEELFHHVKQQQPEKAKRSVDKLIEAVELSVQQLF
ncbi:FadR/GntR family transcriptional regulator [Metabacillus iocasae]|uniref:DNA-binding FadR family transcriptional regulator n=1 Tax=Priestia iocasae TaxID=2291674 RepID=A0ABS2QVK9_9BACI|nr:FadR/GntR family transcriptional regulator [Metabacillus iocasae]MBM7703526.1 DNA-binding FadR family transcriptional regulator [Metabacillus iocasae]